VPFFGSINLGPICWSRVPVPWLVLSLGPKLERWIFSFRFQFVCHGGARRRRRRRLIPVRRQDTVSRSRANIGADDDCVRAARAYRWADVRTSGTASLVAGSTGRDDSIVDVPEGRYQRTKQHVDSIENCTASSE